MKSPLLSVLLLGFAGMASSASAQIAPQADDWGEPVEGVQVHLALATVLPVLPGELPALQMRIRNQGSTAVSVQSEAFQFAQIEVDGTWYAQDIAIAGTARPVVIAPGVQSDLGFIRPAASSMAEMGAIPLRRFALLPGPHRIRIRNLTEQGWLNVRTAEGKVLELVSNYIAINVPALSASAAHEALAFQAATRGVESGSLTNDDPDLAEVQVTGTRIQLPRAIDCVSIADPGVQRTPAQQARMSAESPEVRHAMEVVDRYLAEDLARNQSMLRVNFRRIEDRGDEIWFIYDLEYPTCVLVATDGKVTLVYNKKSGEVSERNP